MEASGQSLRSVDECRQVCCMRPRPKALQSASNIMQPWEQEVAEFDLKYLQKVGEDTKILTEVDHARNIVR